MFEKLIELVSHWWEVLLPCETIDAYEAGVVLRFGVYSRTVGPGLAWKWPIAERILTGKTCVTTLRLPTQTVVTRDDQTVAVSAMIKYEIRDVRSYLLAIWDSVDVLADVSMGAIKRTVNASTYAELRDPSINTEVAIMDLVRKDVNQYGFKIHRVTFTDLARVKALRLLNDGGVGRAGHLDN